MDEYTPEALVNRDEPIPVLNISSRRTSKGSVDSDHSRSSSQSKNLIQDRLLTKLLQQVIPSEDDEEDANPGDKVFTASPKRPGFSLPAMSNNFRRFNARIGVVFLFQNRVERLLAWRNSTHTLSFLFVYSFICLDPHLLLVLPLVILLLFIMVPAFITRHPPPPSTSTSSIVPYYSYEGPALAPARTIKPASETSKDFFRNMRDLQNCMADFSDVHDAIISVFAPLTNFSDEKLLIMLAGGNAAILSNNPTFRNFFQNLIQDVGGDDVGSPLPRDQNHDMFSAALPKDPSAAMSALEKLTDISLDTDPEEREVEIFEIQHRAPGLSESGWENFLFSPQPYDPLSPSRIAGDRPRGCRFFDDVQAPSGWKWKSKKWELDLDCREWVVERMITGVGFEVPGLSPEGNSIVDEIGGWVWDLPSESTSVQEEGKEMTTMGYGDLEPEPNTLSKSKGRSLSKDKQAKNSLDWEEAGSASYGVGEWRRRRWVRIVQRMNLAAAENVTYSTLGTN
ncbi:uncharacterized protein N7477_000572 [Penicillium maclennaniae]|uniref:uncharacterized protein n=1 Tax=Penicillium maclennaniae TaxID=1343394 RepID=UPI002541CBFD|nr:uncharacterized protein N7477_000572 [Penicillium maclennaniae]KAJ5684227.1 hypothetical protein N7477_000572 [Penicillium maclennaniae]